MKYLMEWTKYQISAFSEIHTRTESIIAILHTIVLRQFPQKHNIT